MNKQVKRVECKDVSGMKDSLSELELSIRPQSVPFWLENSNEAHIPKVSNLPSRMKTDIEVIHSDTSSYYESTASEHKKNPERRPRAPIGLPCGSSNRTTNVKGPNSNSRRRRKQHDSLKRVKLSLTESLESLEYFDRNNLGRQLELKQEYITSSEEDPEGNVHFVNIDDSIDIDDSCTLNDSTDESLFIINEPVESFHGNFRGAPSTGFQIPEMPTGKNLVINILSTWGDPFYVGLMGIEIFDGRGHLIHLADIDKQISADPPGLSLQIQDKQDPRTIDKVLDGYNHTCDELHSWLAPFQRGQNHFIYIDFDDSTSISMIRIWNYNTTRIHSFRGARYVEFTLNGVFIFKGEIKRAVGAVSDVDSCSECILFTMNSSILQLIEKYDRCIEKVAISDNIIGRDNSSHSLEVENNRPKTGDTNNNFDRMLGLKSSKEQKLTTESSSHRPQTAPLSTSRSFSKPIMGTVIQMHIKSNWGDPLYVGLTSIEVLDSALNPMHLTQNNISSIAEKKDFYTNPSILFNGSSITTNHEMMWQIPVQICSNSQPTLVLDLGDIKSIGGIKIWNYNASLEDSYKGAKRIVVFIDGEMVSPIEGFLIRKATGNIDFNFGQFLQPKACNIIPSKKHQYYPKNMAATESVASSSPNQNLSITDSNCLGIENNTKLTDDAICEIDFQQYQTPLFPCGCIIKFVILSTWGDTFYVGLNGLEIYDSENNLISLHKEIIEAVPRDINVLPENKGRDIRTLDKLYDGEYNTYNDAHMWLAPFTPSKENLIFIFFDEPVTISKLLLWNYSKTPTRGVREFEIFLDDVLIYHGDLKQSPKAPDITAVNKRTKTEIEMGQAILFTNDKEVIKAESHRITGPIENEVMESVMFIDNSQVISCGKIDDSLRPTTSATFGRIY